MAFMNLLFFAALVSAHAHSINTETLPVLSSAQVLREVGAKVLAQDESIGVGYANVTPAQQEKISQIMHANGKCGGFEVVPGSVTAINGQKLIAGLKAQSQKEAQFLARRRPQTSALPKRPEIVEALLELKEENLRANVEWLSSFPSRSNKLPNPNVHVNELEARLRELLSGYPGMFSVDQISHNRTQQKSLRIRLEGKSRPAEIIVLGGHLDSIVSGWGGGGSRAPGADDNASGSGNLMEALRVLITKGRPERSVEFFWYAGEESGLLGSAEIAQTYKSQNKNVVAVLQLDMTMFPGSGEFVVGNVQDFTSAWLREYLVGLNEAYLGVRLIPDECGYACSDHASWHRQGYPALMPFESDTDNMNRKIHTAADLIDGSSSFRHSLVFAKIALAFAMDLANSTQKQPY
jgi:bacterial leucyl aminopeptidase